jgi:hypothetical protein
LIFKGNKIDRITKRKVFYISGYDPRGYRYYYSLYKKNLSLQNSLNGLNATITSKAIKDKYTYTWDVSSNTDHNTQTKYSFLVWDDIIRDNWSDGFTGIAKDSYQYLRRYVFKGLTSKFAKVNKQRLITGYYPTLYNVFSILIILFICYNFLQLATSFVGIILAFVFSLVIFYLLLKYYFKLGKTLGVFWLGRIYAFCVQWANSEIKDIDQRIEEFSNIILDSFQDDYDEIIISSHSVGTIMMIPVASKVIQKAKENNIDISRLKILTLGHCIPLVTLHKEGIKFRNDLEYIANQDNLTWVDFTAAIDGACFYLDNPVKSAGIKKFKKGPKVLSTRFFKLFKKDTYKKLRYDWYKAHFLYLMATDIKGKYDYFEITAGSKPLENILKEEK